MSAGCEVIRTWARVLAVSTVLLGVGYAGSGVLLELAFDATAAGLVIGALGVVVVVLGVGVWRGRAGAKAGATVVGFFGTVLLGVTALLAQPDPEASNLVNDVGAAIGFGLAGLSALVLATAVTLAALESLEARRERASPLR